MLDLVLQSDLLTAFEVYNKNGSSRRMPLESLKIGSVKFGSFLPKLTFLPNFYRTPLGALKPA